METTNKNVCSLELQAIILEPILSNSILKISFDVLLLKIQKKLPISSFVLKKYLFYLIDYEIISYEGKIQKFLIKDEGYNLLDSINKEITNEMTDINDIVITFEDSLHE